MSNINSTMFSRLRDMNEPSGFVDKSDSTLDLTSNRFTINPAATSFDYYIVGRKYKVSSSDVVDVNYVDLADTEGLHYIYYDGAVLTVAVNPTDSEIATIWETKAAVSIIYWDATNNVGIYVGEERHGIQMDGRTHAYLHYTRGLQYFDGLTLNTIDPDQNGSLDSHAQFGIDAGNVEDEDLSVIISAIGSTDGMNIYYRDGATGAWRRTTQANFAVKVTGTGRLAWNELTGGSWQLTEVDDNKFVLYHIFATTEKDNPMISVMGQNTYLTQSGAREGATTEINSLLLGNLPTPEIRPIATVIFQTKDSYTNSVNARIRTTDEGDDYVDWRVSEFGRGVAAGDHGSLAGLSDDDHTGYILADGTRDITDIIITDTISFAYPTVTPPAANVSGIFMEGTGSNKYLTIQSADSTTTVHGHGIQLAAGDGNETLGFGGKHILIYGGVGTTAHSSGSVNIWGGYGSSEVGAAIGGTLLLAGGDAQVINSDGGPIEFRGGYAWGTGTPGDYKFYSNPPYSEQAYAGILFFPIEDSDKTFTFPNTTGTIALTSDLTDEKVGIDSGATPGYLGATSNDGVLRTSAPLTYADGGDFITLGIDQTAIDHGSIGGLTDIADHPGYLILTGARAGATSEIQVFNNGIRVLDKIEFTQTDGNEYIDSLNDGYLDIGATTAIRLLQDTNLEGTLLIKEQATANADVASYGQLWVKTATPNELWFTDDAGTDVQLGVGAADQNLWETISSDSGSIAADSTTDTLTVVGGEGISTSIAGDTITITGEDASTTNKGIVELATTAETQTGTETGMAVTPDGLHDMTALTGAGWFLDEDNMVSDDATKVASQQSIKAYIVASVADYLKLDCSNDPLTATLETQTLVPSADVTYDFGTAALRYNTIYLSETAGEINFDTNRYLKYDGTNIYLRGNPIYLQVSDRTIFRVLYGHLQIRYQVPLRWYSGDNYVGFQYPTAAIAPVTVDWHLPTADAAGFWKSDGSAKLSIEPLTFTDLKRSDAITYHFRLDVGVTTILDARPWQDETVNEGTFKDQLDVPRNILIEIRNLEMMISTTGTVTINGNDADGATLVEVITIDTPPGAPETYTGNKAFARVTSIVVDQTGIANALYSVGIGTKIGFPNYPWNATGDVFKVTVNAVDVAPAGYTVNTTYGTVDTSASALPAINDFMTVWYRPYKA